ncbi:MAG TPA: type VI secretion system domain-containing protein [Bryobacteraceae bacterium]|nr:type VI secretion system domain-containing protein [Bryobacteraceae bacterium]
MALCQIGDSGSARFFETWSCHKPRIDPDADPPTTYESAQIDCIIDVSRIAHHLHAAVHEAGATFSSVVACEAHLRQRIAPYVVPEYARGTSLEAVFPLVEAHVHVSGAPDWRGKSKLELSVLPRRAGAPLAHPINIAVSVALPWPLTQETSPQPETTLRPQTALLPIAPVESANDSISGRDQFIRRMLMAEICLAGRKLDVAVMILEDLSEQIDRYHLAEWESSHFVTGVWDLLRRCYLLVSPSPEAAERSNALLRRICRLDPTRVVE